MPIPKWCDKKSIRTVKRGGARILICCPKKKWKAGHCTVGTRVIDVRSAKLIKGAKKEHREHPWTSMKQARRIAADHLRENPRAYGGLRVNLATKPKYRTEKYDGDLYFRSAYRWSKVSKGVNGRWYIAKGWKGDTRATKLEHTNRKAHALIIAEGWVEDD